MKRCNVTLITALALSLFSAVHTAVAQQPEPYTIINRTPIKMWVAAAYFDQHTGRHVQSDGWFEANPYGGSVRLPDLYRPLLPRGSVFLYVVGEGGRGFPPSVISHLRRRSGVSAEVYPAHPFPIHHTKAFSFRARWVNLDYLHRHAGEQGLGLSVYAPVQVFQPRGGHIELTADMLRW